MSPASTGRPGTPLPSGETPSAEVIAAEETTVRQYATTITDIRAFQSSVLRLWREEISLMVPDLGDEDAGVIELQGVYFIRLMDLVKYC